MRRLPKLSGRAWLALAVLCGVALGVGGYTFTYAEGASYLSTDPRACVNCHIMRSQYDSWQKSSHHAAAGCVDCHLPASGLSKWVAKGLNGWNHSKAFTLQDFPEPIRIKPGNAKVLEQNCVRCHAPLVEAVTEHGTLGVPTDPLQQADLYGCVRCHSSVGHGPTR